MVWLHSFFFKDTATTEIYTLSLHGALPISRCASVEMTTFTPAATAARAIVSFRSSRSGCAFSSRNVPVSAARAKTDRKSTRLNSSHANISHAVFCLKKQDLHGHRGSQEHTA